MAKVDVTNLEMESVAGPARGRRGAVLPLVVLVLGAVLWALIVVHTRFMLEDAFITFRYSANILNGYGFVFNAGERVLGTTTPLQTLLLAFLAFPFGPGAVPTVAAVVMPVFGLLAGAAGYFGLTRKGIARAAAAIGMGLVYAHVVVIRTGIGGMETPLALLLMAASLWALVAGRPAAVGVLLGLLVLCRIDGLIWSVLVFAASLVRFRRRIVLQAVVFGAILLCWGIFATLYFGSPLPNSMLAKGVVRPGQENALFDLERVRKYAAWLLSGTGLAWSWKLAPISLLVLAAGVWRLLRQSPRELGLLVVFPPVYALAMYFGRAPRYEWYLLPIMFASLFAAGVGIYEVLRWIGSRLPRRVAPALPHIGVALAVAAVVGYCVSCVPPMLRHLRMAQENEDGLRRSVGLWLRDNTPSSASVAMEAIGYQGYYSQRRIIDMAGLVTPEVVEYNRRTRQNGRVFNWILRDLRPDYIVLRSFEVDTNRHFNGGKLFPTEEERREFQASYRQARRFVAPYPASAPLVRHLTVYERTGGALTGR